MLDWAKGFIEETVDLRRNNQKLLLILDGYGSHVQFSFLNALRESGIIVVALPSHTSHVLQPLDVSVFSSFKSFLQQEIHKLSRAKKVLNVFDIAVALFFSYFQCLTPRNICNGFVRTGIWNPRTLDVDITALHDLFREEEKITLENLLNSFSRQGRSLIFDADIGREGTIRVNTTAGAHLTSQAILDALSARDKKKASKVKKNCSESSANEAPASDLNDGDPSNEDEKRRYRWTLAKKTRVIRRERASARSLCNTLQLLSADSRVH